MFGGERRAHPPRCPQSSEQTLRCRPHNHREVVARQACHSAAVAAQVVGRRARMQC